ncbi:hypothetical protein QC761_0081090 [Podospora bellae-mahoneyi]|uniref:Uncharacterized protein n=1 Tax=Podospora bellae-mahoneyi TaxID=2093777 RepID=A0ABR0FDR5_9PEZI|nr:hypothetical protein QC761_0081090 [Podospora bellae-mahoneyi]
MAFERLNTIVNCRDSTFAAVTPANSRHAAKLAQIALAVQSRQNTPTPSRRKWLPGSAKPRLQIRDKDTARVDDYYTPSSQPPLATSYYQHQHYQTYPPRQQPYPLRRPSEAIATAPSSRSQRHITPALIRIRAKKPPTTPPPHDSTDVGVPEATRFQTYHRTTYQVKSSSAGGKIKVSGPVGSNEAQLFDAIAAAKSITSGFDMRSSKDDCKLVRHRTGGRKEENRGAGYGRDGRKSCRA